MKNNNQQIRRGDIFYYDFGVTEPYRIDALFYLALF